MRAMLPIVTLALLLPAIGLAAPAAPEYPMRTYACRHAAGPITIDGRLDDPGWRAASWSDSFGDMFAPDRRVEEQTMVKAAWDDQALYVALKARDRNPWATLRERDAALFTEQVLEVYIDENNDQRNYREFEVNPLGAEIDLLIPYAGAQADWPRCAQWNAPGWKTAVRVRPSLDSWVAEMAFPWAIFTEAKRLPPRPGDLWRIQFYRIERPDRPSGPRTGPSGSRRGSRPDDLIGTAWSPTPTFHAPKYFGAIRFVR